MVLWAILAPAMAFAESSIAFSAQSVKSSFEKGNEKTTLSGNATVSTGSLRIQSDSIEIIGAKQRYIRAEGNVSVKDDERGFIVQGSRLMYDREMEIVKLDGNATLEDFKNDVLIRAVFFEYRMKENTAIFNVGVKMFKKDLDAKAEYGSFSRDTKVLELNGLPVVTKGKDVYKANLIRVNTETDEIQLSGSVRGEVETKKDATNGAEP